MRHTIGFYFGLYLAIATAAVSVSAQDCSSNSPSQFNSNITVYIGEVFAIMPTILPLQNTSYSFDVVEPYNGRKGFRLWVAMDDLFSAKQVSFCADTWGDDWNNPPGLSQRVTVSTFNVPWTPTLNGMGGPTTKWHIRLWDFEFLSSNGAILRFFISTQ